MYQNTRRFLVLGVVSAAAVAGTSQSHASLYRNAVLADNPLVYLPLNETSGSTAFNQGSLGAAGNGTYVNVTLGQASANTNLGTAAGFTGSSAVRVTDNAAFDVGTGAFTVEMWYRTTSDGRGDLFTYKGAGGDYGIHSNSQPDLAGADGSASTFFNGFNGQAAASNNQFHHLVATRAAAGGAYKMYIDGNLAFSGTDGDTWNIANDILLGANHSGSPVNLNLGFNGQIDEAAIYNTELSANRVADHFAAAQGVANSIGVNFIGGAGATGTLASTTVAGVIPQANWNNGGGSDGTLLNLNDRFGVATTVDITYDGDSVFQTASGNATGNHSLYAGYVDDTDNSTSNYTFSEIPFARYDVYVYTDSDAADSRDESFSLLSSSGQLFAPVFVSDEANFSGAFIQATATSLNGTGAQGNYVLFRNVEGSSFTLTGQSLNFRNFVSAIQINAHAIPEPATASLALLGMGGLMMRRRRMA